MNNHHRRAFRLDAERTRDFGEDDVVAPNDRLFKLPPIIGPCMSLWPAKPKAWFPKRSTDTGVSGCAIYSATCAYSTKTVVAPTTKVAAGPSGTSD